MKLSTKATKLAISKDWQGVVSSLGIYKPLHLLELAGPIALGIYLEPSRGADVYTPIGHLHCLAIEFPVISLGVSVSVKDVSMRAHGTEIIAGRWDMLRTAMPLLGERPCRLSTLWKQYEAGVGDGRFPVVTAYLPVYSAMVATASFFGHEERARKVVSDVEAQLDSLQSDPGGKAEKWKVDVVSLLERERVVATVEREAAKFGLSDLPKVPILDDF
jgi:hypothetical protein